MKFKRLFLNVLTLLMAFRVSTVSISAEEIISCMEPRWNNVATATLSIGFDKNNVGYFEISVNHYPSCTGISGQMRLLDESGNLLASWAIYDDVSPYAVEHTYQCQEGKTYTLTFQGYAYGNGSTQFDDINLSTSDTCD